MLLRTARSRSLLVVLGDGVDASAEGVHEGVVGHQLSCLVRPSPWMREGLGWRLLEAIARLGARGDEGGVRAAVRVDARAYIRTNV